MKNKIDIFIFLLWLFSVIFCAPPHRARPHDTDATTPAPKKVRLDGPCYFSQLRKSTLETEDRPVRSKVSLDCQGEMKTLGVIGKEQKLSKNLGETNASALLLCRGAGECDLDFNDENVANRWKDVQVCDHHLRELLTEWKRGAFHHQHIFRQYVNSDHKDACSMPKEICKNHITSSPYTHLHFLTVQESHAILKNLGYLVHPGIPVCREHHDVIKSLINPNHESSSSSHYQSSSMDLDNTCAANPNFIFPEFSNPQHSPNPAAKSLSQFAKFAKVDRICFPQKDFDDLDERTKQKKTCGVQKLLDLMVGIAAPTNPGELKKRVLSKYGDGEEWSTGSSKDLDAILRQVQAQFRVAEDRRTKLIILGLVANSVTLTKIREYIPDLSSYFYTEARKFARRDRSATPTKPSHREYYNEAAVQSFISFISSSTVMIGLPYGYRNVKLSDGSKQAIPDSIRQQTSSEIFEMYENYLEEIGKKDELGLSKSSIFAILEACAATDRKSTTCVDYYVANGMQAFEGLHKIIDGWLEESLTADDILKYLKDSLYEGAQYLRTDFRLHVKQFSRVADHCANFALSDPNQPEMSSSCSVGPHAHKHDYKCERCEKLSSAISEIKRFVQNFLAEAEEAVADDESNPMDKNKQVLEKRKEEVDLINRYETHIFEMKKHLLRSAFTGQERQNIIDSLKDNEGLVTLDFAQKYLPTWHREKQSDYFGKKGISYHVAHIAAKVEGKYVQHTFVHIYKHEVPQDSRLVVQTISHIASELKDVGITKISLRSDNAGAYHCAPTIHSLLWLEEESGVAIDTYTFSEAQNGKGASDRGASQVKYRAERYVAQGNDITTPEQFFTAMGTEPYLNGFSFHLGNVSVEEGDVAKWSGISNLNHFKVEKGGIRGFRYGSIGKGTLVPKALLKPMKGSYDFESIGFLANDSTIAEERKAVLNGEVTKFWYYSACAKESKCIAEPDDSTPEIYDGVGNEAEIGNSFACTEPGCSANFLKVYNLDKHLLRDKHKISPERFTMRDYGIQLYSRNLEQVKTEHTNSAVQDALNKFQETDVKTGLCEGYGFPAKQKKVPFTTKSKEYLLSLFNEGLGKKARPIDPIAATRRMETDSDASGSKLFSVNERLDVQQISGFFRRESKKRRTNPRSKRDDPGTNKKDDEKNDEDDYEPDEEEHPDAPLFCYMKDESYTSQADRFFNAIIDANIFDFSSKKSN